MAAINFNDLNRLRTAGYHKDEQTEDFLKEVNQVLQNREVDRYQDVTFQYPMVYVFGLPRSGTTLLAQLITRAFKPGYINNFMARFWLAPVTGIRLSKIILGDKQQTDLASEYANTEDVYDLHEFGYFWRYWLHIQSPRQAALVEQREKEIDWGNLSTVLSNIQQEFGKMVCMKNIFGAYHMPRITREMPRTLWIHIKRNPLDVAISILNARKKFYNDLNNWWSTVPIEYDQLKGMHYLDQIAGQVYHLERFYQRQAASLPPKNILKLDYEEVCHNPRICMNSLAIRLQDDFGCQPSLFQIPPKLNYNKHKVDSEEKEQLRNALNQYNLL